MPTADTPVPRQLSDEERALWERCVQYDNPVFDPAVILSLLTALSSEREAGERYKAALDAIEFKGYMLATDSLGASHSHDFANLASIASEAINPQTEADEIDCRSYCK